MHSSLEQFSVNKAVYFHPVMVLLFLLLSKWVEILYISLPHHLLLLRRLRNSRSSRVTPLFLPSHLLSPIGAKQHFSVCTSYSAACARLPALSFLHVHFHAPGERSLCSSSLCGKRWNRTERRKLEELELEELFEIDMACNGTVRIRIEAKRSNRRTRTALYWICFELDRFELAVPCLSRLVSLSSFCFGSSRHFLHSVPVARFL